MSKEKSSSSADRRELLDHDLRPALGRLHDARRSRYRIVTVYALVCLVAVVASSLYVTFELIGGDDAWLAFIPTVAFLAGVGVLITVFAYFLHVKIPLQRQFRREILGPIAERITPKYRDQSSAEMERDEWKKSGLFPDSTHQLKSEHLTALRIDELTVGFCHLRLDADLLRPSGDDQAHPPKPLVGRGGFDGLFLVSKPAYNADVTVLVEPRSSASKSTESTEKIELSDPPPLFDSLYQISGTHSDFDQRFSLYASEAREMNQLLPDDLRRRLVDLHDSWLDNDPSCDSLPPFLLSLRDGKCHIAIGEHFPTPPLRPRAKALDEDEIAQFSRQLDMAVQLAAALR